MTRLGRSRLRDAAYGAIWSITEEKLDAVIEFLDLRASGHTLSKAELRARGFSSYVARPFMAGAEEAGKQIAVLPLRGTIAHHAGWEMEASGGTSTVAFGHAFDAAMANPNVGAIVIDCDSPGGTVEGVAELFSKIYAARGKGKRLIAVANAHMHSAALWVCGACDEIVVTPSGQIGNIGVMTVRTDISAMDAKDGIKRTVIKAGQFKGEGAPFEPMTEEEYAATLAKIETVYGMFAADFAKGRGDTVANVKAGYGQGRSVTAKEAVKLGLADRVATFEQVIAEYGASAPAAKPGRSFTSVRADAEPAPEVCPDCGREMEMEDGALVCPECDEPPVDASAELTRMAARALAGAVTAGVPAGVAPIAAAATPLSTTPTSIATTQESRMPDNIPAVDLTAERTAMRAAEVERVKQIRAVCADHGLSLKADKFIEDGLTIDQVRAAILEEKRTVTTATRVPLTSGTSHVQVGATRADMDPSRGFRSPRAWAVAVMNASDARDPGQLKDERLRPIAVQDGDGLGFMLPQAFTPSSMLLATQGSDEQSTSFPYGGSTVQRAQSSTLLQIGAEGDPTVGRTTDVPMEAPLVEFDARVDKNHTTSVSGGFVWTRKAEAATGGTSRGQFEKIKLEANTLFGAAFATYEILQRSRLSFAAVIESGFREQLGPHMLNEKLRGGGAGEYLGVLTALASAGLGPTISIAKESNQLADTIVTANLIKARARCWGYGQAIWLANHDTYPQLATLSVGVGTAGALVYQQSMVEDRPDMLLGRPIFYTEYANTLGDQGDIILGNWSQYLEGMYSPVQSEESIHARFFANEKAFKFFLSNAGLPWWKTALTPNKGTNTLSPFVVLDAR